MKKRTELFRKGRAKAHKVLEDWLKVTGIIPDGTSYQFEIESVVEDAYLWGYAAGKLDGKKQGKANE